MGGRGSGGHNRLSDEEKKKRGTYRNNTREEVYEERAAAKVISGPWLTSIPESEYPLTEVGRKKYDELTKELFEQQKLTTVTAMRASAAALHHQKIHALAQEGKYPTASDFAKLQSALKDLDIAKNAKVTQAPGATKRFDGCGFANKRSSPYRLPGYPANASRK